MAEDPLIDWKKHILGILSFEREQRRNAEIGWCTLFQQQKSRIKELEDKMKQEENKISENVIDLEERKRLLMAGKEPPGGGNWLAKLPKGTRFLANRRSLNDSSLCDFFIGSDPTKMPAVFLGFELNHRDGGFRFVDPVKFSRDYEFFMTIETEFQDDGTDVQTGGVEGDGQS
jgi:hypothetical protein